MRSKSWLSTNFPILDAGGANEHQWLVLNPDDAEEVLQRAKPVLDSLGGTLRSVVKTVLEQWNEAGADVLLDIVPRLVNPHVLPAALNPTGMRMQDAFPQFSLMLERTQELVVLIDTARQEDVVVAGVASGVPDHSKRWAYYVPQSLESLDQLEVETGIQLSPQLRQMYARVGGALDVSVCPYICKTDELQSGFLYTEIYQDLVEQLQLSADLVDRLRSFVVLTSNATGDSQGFFPDQPNRGKAQEYTIYQWNHESTSFTVWAVDFAEALTREILGRW